MERRFRIHKIILAALFLSAWLSTSVAQAVDDEPKLPVYGIEVRLSAFRPVLSTDSAVESVRNEIFRDNSNWLHARPFRYAVEFDYYPFTQFGLLGIYGRLGFWRQSAHSRVCFAADGKTVVQCTAATIAQSSVGADDAAINIAPVSLGAVYRYDMLRRQLDFPLLLSTKVGVDYFLWWATLGDSAARMGGPNGPLARGGTLGVTAAVQAALPLDAFRSSAPLYGTKEAKQSNYFFVEYAIGYAPGLFQKQPRFDMTDLVTVTIGLSIDMS